MFAIFTLSILAASSQASTLSIVSKTNNTAGSADNSALTRDVTFTTSDFATGSVISDVNLSVSFEKISGTCPTHDGGWPFNREIYAFLTSPAGTQVALIEDSGNNSGSGTGYTYTSSEVYGGSATVLFDDTAATVVGGPAPASGTFRPIQPLSAYNGEDPLGIWTLTMGDSGAGDPLCFGEYTLIIEADQPPTVDDQTFSVSENSPNGTVVGTIVATDPDAGDKLNYVFTAGNEAGIFALDALSGEITVADGSQLDYETTPSYSLTVEVTDSSFMTDTAAITINVTNANEPPTDIALDNNDVNENQPIGTVVGNFSTTDPDVGDTHTYTLVAGAGDSGNGSFGTNGDQLVTAVSLDYETQSSYSIRVQTDDGNGGTYEEVFTITVNDINDAPTDIALDNSTVLEHQPQETLVGNFSASDQDSGDIHTYLLVPGTGDTGNGSFDIEDNQLLTAEEFDFETQNSYSIRVQVSDGNGGVYAEVFTISVLDGNDPPTDIALDNDIIAENMPAGTAVGNFTATDPNIGDSHTFTLVQGTGDADNASFTISGGELQTNVVFDFEGQNSYSIRVQADDGSGGTFEKPFTITVTDANDAPTNISIDSNSVPENMPIGTLVGTFTTSDQDAGDSHTYALVAGTGDDNNSSFTINGDQLETAEIFDYETQNSYSIRVQTDDGNGGTFEKQFTILITADNDAPTNIILDNSSVAENQPAGAFVGNFTTTDPDVGDSHTYALVAGTGDNDNGSFTISGDQLLTGEMFNFETQNIYHIRIETSDNGGLTYQKPFTITVTNVNDAPIAIDDIGATDEDTVLTVPAAGVLSNDSDEDAGDTVTVSGSDAASAYGAVVNVAADGGYSYDPTAVTALQALSVGAIVTDTFTYTMTDGLLTDTAVVSIAVTGVNDNPTANDDTTTTLEGTAVTIPVLDNDDDPDTADILTVSNITQGANGAVVNNGDGTLTYTPDAGFSGSDAFTYTIADGAGGSDTATVNVTVNPGSYAIFLPVMLNNYTPAPDLVVNSVTASSDAVEVVIQNQGSASTDSGFWVDFYIDPNPVPTAANQEWPELSSEGIAWGITVPLAAGEQLTLTYSTVPGAPNLYFSPENSLFSGSLSAGTPIYAQVDSARAGSDYGAILETHEIYGTSYNNVSAPATAD